MSPEKSTPGPPSASSGGESLLSLVDVHKPFRAHRGSGRSVDVRAVDGVSLAVARGETLGLVGGSGSGKSTLARIALRLIRTDAGRVLFSGHDLGAVSRPRLRALRAAMHLIHQDPYESLAPRLRVVDIVCEPMVIQRSGTTEERVSRAIDALGQAGLHPAADFAARFPHELSGGQRQRVALARAITLRPRLIVADEPTSMLDASLRAALLETMRAYRDASGAGFLFITHDLALARSFCDRVIVLLDGRIVEEGPTAAVIGSPAHPYTRALIAAARDLRPPPSGDDDHAHRTADRAREPPGPAGGPRSRFREVGPEHRVAD